MILSISFDQSEGVTHHPFGSVRSSPSHRRHFPRTVGNFRISGDSFGVASWNPAPTIGPILGKGFTFSDFEFCPFDAVTHHGEIPSMRLSELPI
jgi:hypothetical protein